MKMNIKQLLCLLVLAVSGNTFGLNNTTPPDFSGGVAPRYQTPPPPPSPHAPGWDQGSIHLPTPPPPPPPPMNTNYYQMAEKHFQPTGMSMEHSAMTQMMEMDNKHMTHPDLAKKHIQLIQEAYKAGNNDAYMKIGTYLQPAITQMGLQVTASKSDLKAAATAQGIK